MSDQEVLILVVDDQEDVRAALVELLGTAGYRAAEAADGLAAINQIEVLHPALVLMDVKMPVMDGVDATREICRRFPGTLVVAHSAYQDATLVRDMISSGAKGYVLKGAGGSEVIKAIRSTLEQKSSISDGVARPILDDLEALYRREQERAERLASLVGDLQQTALTDHVTGLFNHRYFHERLNEELLAAGRRNQALCLAIFDVDDFKQVNDRFGHAQGDLFLQRMAVAVRACARTDDLVFRIGGDEFAIIMPDTSGDEGLRVARVLCQGIARLAVEHMPNQTVSIGVAEYPRSASSKDGLVDAADLAMYESKRSGRNRASIFSQGTTGGGRLPERRQNTTANLAENVLSAALRLNHPDTYEHCQRVSVLSDALARALNLPHDEVEVARLAGMLHDIGKIGVDNDVLDRGGPLGMDDWDSMRQHPVHAEGLLALFFPPSVVSCVAAHHEQPDGHGYPRGLKAEQIPRTAAVVRVADAFDAMTADRAYRPRRSVDQALVELARGEGILFDTEAVEALIRTVRARVDDQAA